MRRLLFEVCLLVHDAPLHLDNILKSCHLSLSSRFVAVPLYDSLGESSVEYIIGHSEASIVFTSTQKFPLLEKTLHKTKDNIKIIVYFGDVTEDSKRTSQAAEKEVSTSSDLHAAAWQLGCLLAGKSP